MTGIEQVVVLGCGFAGTAVAELARSRGMGVLTNVRSEARAEALRAGGFEVLVLPSLATHADAIAARIDSRTHVVIAFQPDASTDAVLAPHLAGAAAVTYVSSTGVYGDTRGVVDDTTPVPPPDERAARILAAEDAYRPLGATILRCPALYGRERGLHVRVLRGEHKIPGDGWGYVSRIHVDDLAQFVLAAGERSAGFPKTSETFVVGDLEPARHVDVVRFVCETHGVPTPPSIPLAEVHASLRADRRVDAARAIAAFGVTLRYPSYREGMRDGNR